MYMIIFLLKLNNFFLYLGLLQVTSYKQTIQHRKKNSRQALENIFLKSLVILYNYNPSNS